MKRILFLCLLLAPLCITNARAQSSGELGSLSGRVYSDYYWMAQNHNADLEGENGFWFRRIYLTYEKALSESFSARLRLEMSSEGDFLSSSKMTPVVKDAYLKWSGENQSVYAGISGTPTWGLVEEVWGYRSLEKSPLDLFGFGSSRDFGLAVKGTMGEEGNFHYHAMLGNGNSNRNETNSQKKAMLSLGYELSDGLTLEAYGDYAGAPDDRYRYTLQGFLGYETDTFTAGALYAYQYRNNQPALGDYDLNLLSFFSHFQLSDGVKGVLRVDKLMEPNPGAAGIDYIPMSPLAEPTFMLAGVDVELEKNIHLIPNVETVFYGDTQVGPDLDTDIIPRLTLYYRF